jgi:hypothetical protein
MRDDWPWNGPSLREETRTAKGHALELLITVVLVSTLLSLAINLGSSLLLQTYGWQLALLVMGICFVLAAVAMIVLMPGIFTRIKEFHEEVEILLPLLASSEDVEVIRLNYYDRVTELLHAALTRCSADERKDIAQALGRMSTDNAAETRQEIVMFALELMQFLFTTQVVRGSERLLGAQAPYHKFREVIQLLPSVVVSQWNDLANQVPSNRYFHRSLPRVPEKIRLPRGIRLQLPGIAEEIASKSHSHPADQSRVEEITLLKANVGRDTALAIAALATFGEHGLPRLNAPRRGFTARCILRNARDQRLRRLANEEELAATQLNDSGQPIEPVSQGEPDPVTRYASVHTKLYEGGQRPYLLRVFVRFDGSFRINLFKTEKRQYGLYPWGTALSQYLAQMDIEEFMAALKDAGQKTPRRTF